MKQKLLALSIVTLIAAPTYAGTVTTNGQDLILSTENGIKVDTVDKSASFQLGGRLQWDYDDTNSDTVDSTDFDTRRARIYIKGHVNDWAYKMQFNIAESEDSEGGTAEDLYIRYTGFGRQAHVTVGKQREPFGLEDQTSSNDMTLLERSAITELYAPARSGGIQVSGAGSNWTYGIGFFEAGADSSDDFDHTALTGRVTFNPINDGDILVHVGAAFSTRDGDATAPGTSIRTQESDVFGLELAGVMGPFHAQAEYMDAEIGDEDADGFYVQVGYIITGETRPYKNGVFKRVKPTSKSGAWEVVLRLEDGDGKYSDAGVGTGKGSQTSVGVNWYASNNIRLGLSYMDAKNDDTDNSGDELRARVQLAF